MYKLTPFDAELARMVSSLTERECEPLVIDDCYTLIVDYSDHLDADYISAIFRAIEGRAGDRLMKIEDEPELHRAKVYIKLEDNNLPDVVMGVHDDGITDYGVTFCRRLGECKALQVRRDNGKRLIRFVGNGDLELPEDGLAVFTFRNAFGGVYCRAFEGDYIQFVRDGLYAVIPCENFEALWEPK